VRQISLVNYTVKARNPEGRDIDVPYDVKNSMIEILFSRDLQLSAREALNRDDLARKIRDCANGSILLEEADYSKLEKAVDTIKGFGRADVEFVRRVLDAKRVEVDAKKEKGEGEEEPAGKPVLLKNKPPRVKGNK